MRNTCEVIWDELQPIYLPEPNIQDWHHIGFSNRWNFPNCVGTLDEKHIVLQSPAKSGSLYFNYKGTFSLVLMALVDHEYRFTYIDVGDYGSNADSAICKNSNFGKAFINGQLAIPPPKHLPNFPEGGPIPHYIVADEAFPLHIDLMRPYPRCQCGVILPSNKQLFNYRLSRACCIVENAFDILAQ